LGLPKGEQITITCPGPLGFPRGGVGNRPAGEILFFRLANVNGFQEWLLERIPFYGFAMQDDLATWRTIV